MDIIEREDPTIRWQPGVGEETRVFLESLQLPPADSGGRDRLLREAVSTLARCHPPTAPNAHETGLVIGYVQSGKTTSFTTVAALARDNGYRLLIICTGLTRNLFTQSSDRLARDLRLSERSDRQWLFLPNPRARVEEEQMVATALEGGRTVLLPVMKNGRHLDNLSQLLTRLSLQRAPALIIDDEADQASLNNEVRRNNRSATYRRILGLRDLVPHHTFLQYTATPQALLLINLIDMLSPGFAEILTPGAMYTGGHSFFERDMDLVRTVPIPDIPTQQNVLRGAPPSLQESLRVYWLGVAAGLLGGSQGNRSMMIHPSQRTLPHADYHQWVRAVQSSWASTLALEESDPDRQTLIERFLDAYEDLSRTADDLPPFDELVPRLGEAMRQTIVTQVNAARGRTPQPDWRQFYAHIVVGGEVLNRGVTVEGLTVAYMPRGPGTSQADTIQQRARWFGYKADYLGYCRVYISDQMRRLYRAYVDHESGLRDQLEEFRATGEDLRRWRRAFFIDPGLRPTRNQVIDLDPLRGSFADTWFAPSTPHDPPEATEANRGLVRTFLEAQEGTFEPDEGHARRTDIQAHLVANGVPLQDAFRDLLTQLWLAQPRDSVPFAGLLLQVGRYLDDHPDATCTVYRMSRGATRERSVGPDNAILNLFQGANYDESVRPRVTLYPGDRAIHSDGELTIQIHTLRLKDGSTVIADNVPNIAVWVPRVMSGAWLSQPQ
ncbi:MAG TPA: Z1 domain-containing protein [Actinomycetota bacterium]